MGAPYFMHNRSFFRHTPDVDLAFLQASFDNVPYDQYFTNGQRFRTTSRVEITDRGFKLLPKRPLYQPPSVNKLEKYGGICRDYEDAPVSLIESEPFHQLIMEWISRTGLTVKSFSVHQIRTTGTGSPVPEGRHHDGTDWTGLYVLKRHGIEPESARTTYWDRDGEIVMSDILSEGELITFEDGKYTHDTTALEPTREGAYRDVFVLTLPEHGVNVPADMIGE
ncbi:2OG-Fe dioxygenase family protein [Trinickia acidisoli]|uniref:2OG-Fe dioxygenase family protein n=1 Tax=Trinickia acidisoli TaxID=2767482 RepID=UPI001A8E06BB|nr:2OG-Fe dioxygenase family protein [Trinickia acidisoli]